MIAPDDLLRRVLILADESANWKIAGLRQLDRILLGLNEYAARQGEPIEVSIQWKRDVAIDHWPLPDRRPLAGLRIRRHAESKSSEQETADHDRPDLVLTTRAVISRAQPGDTTFSIMPAEEDHVRAAADCGRIERNLLRRTGKSQDGIIARYFDRKISRYVTRLLLKFPITPSAWTLGILPFAVAAFVAFVYGGRAGILLGMLFVEIHSILDGCDGEIARAKYLESESGQRLDTFCDVTAEILLVLGIAAGLSRRAMSSEANTLYALEGLITAGLIVFRERLLAKTAVAGMDEQGSSVYLRHAHLVNRSGMLVFGKRFAAFVIQLTKRDVGISFFLFLALIGGGEWILHLLFAVTAISLALAWRAR